MAVKSQARKHLVPTQDVIDYVKQNGHRKSDQWISLAIRRLTGDQRWTRHRVYRIRMRLGIHKGATFRNNRGVPIGTIRVRNSNKYPARKKIKIGDRQWVPLARYVWEQANGPAPKGYRVIHLDNDQMNCELSNLELMPDKEACSYVAHFVERTDEWKRNVGNSVRHAKQKQKKREATNAYLTHTPYEFSR